MFNDRSGEMRVRVLRRLWYVGDGQNLRSHWVTQKIASETQRDCNETVISLCDTETRCN